MARTCTWLLAVMLFVYAPLGVRAEASPEYPALRDSHSPRLQAQLERALAGLGLWRAIEAKRLSVALVDLSDPKAPRLAAVNGDEMFYAASLPKIAILLAAFVGIERGELALDSATRDSLTRMVRHSSNVEATRMLRRVGRQELLDILRSDRFRLYDPRVNGGLWVGKAYGSEPAYRRDPLHHLSHGATALQTARFYYLLETERLVAPRLCREMKSMLSDPAINHKFVKGLEHRPGVRIYRKSGTWRQWHADSAIVEEGDRKYIVVALAAHPDGGQWLARMIEPLHSLIVSRDAAGKYAATVH